MSFIDLTNTSINFIHDRTFDKSNQLYARDVLTPICNRFVGFQITDDMEPSIISFDDFRKSICGGSALTIIATDGLNDKTASIIENIFPLEVREVLPEAGILNFVSELNTETNKKQFKIRTFHGNFILHPYGIDMNGIEAVPELLTPPFDIIEHACIFIFRGENPLIYITSHNAMSMKAAIFALAQREHFNEILSSTHKSIVIRLRRYAGADSSEKLTPQINKISMIPMVDLRDNSP